MRQGFGIKGCYVFLSECTSHLGEYAANRGGRRGHGERGKRGVLITGPHFVKENVKTSRAQHALT